MATLFLTGATGMVGREILARAVADWRFDRVACLVRPSRDGAPQARLDEILAKIGVSSTKAVAVAGDVVKPHLGLSAADRDLLADTTHVVHCAATVTFDHPLEEARRINVAGTRAVVDLARRLPKLERLDAVSTAYVAGKRDDLVLEADLEHDRGFHNTYEQTKYESEIQLRAAMADLPIAVHRPSIVVGDSRTGKTGAWKVLYWPLKVIARGWLRVVPYDPDARLDIVPVDFVADGVMALSRDPAAIGRTFHFCAGPRRDSTMDELATALYRRLDRRKPIRVNPRWWRRAIRPAMMLAPSQNLRRTLKTGLVYRPYLEMRQQFDTRGTDAALASAGVKCPSVLAYIDTIVDEALRTDFGRRD